MVCRSRPDIFREFWSRAAEKQDCVAETLDVSMLTLYTLAEVLDIRPRGSL